MKVLHIINNLTMGGAESLLVSMLPLMREEIEVDLLLLDDKESPLLDKLNAYNINIISWPNSHLYNPAIIFKIIPIIKSYSVVHVHLFPAMYYVAFAKLLSWSTVKLVFTEHSTNNRRLKSWFFRLTDRLVYLNYSKIVCITPEVKNVLSKLGVSEKKLSVIYNGIQLEKFLEAVPYNRSEFGYSEHDIILVMVAAFRREKNHSLVIKGLKELDRKYKLLLIGDGYLKGEVESEVNELDLNDRVKFLGVRDDVNRLLKTCDIGILSSHWEGFGLAAVEAMASGLPVVASDVPGLAEVVMGGGLLFKPEQMNDFLAKVISLEEKRYYQDIKKKCLEKAGKYDLKRTVQELILMYNRLDR
ncbi:hypothetical protein BWD42_24270 [Sphingobacterium sp. CZ-UAM]|nr:hypothetical protein BWD42_24270 [Sphingobacterium sp. CZ-UAM]